LTRPAPRFRGNHPQDWALVVLAIWLFISPWVLHFGGAAPAVVGGAANGAGIGHACWNAWILGVILVLVAISAVGRVRVNQEWLTLVLGGWIFIAPWALGFVVLPRASWDHWIVGIVVVLIALANLPMFRTVHPVGTLTPPPRQPPMT
jgi:hypothetical protein